MKKTAKQNNFTFFLSLASLFLFFLLLLLYPSQNVILSAPKLFKSGLNEIGFEIPPPSKYPLKVASPSALPEITAQSYLVLDAKSDVVLFSKDKNARLKIASITKLMTALTALDIYKNSDVLTVKQAFQEGATIELEQNDKLYFIDLIRALLISSANDAAQTIADNSTSDFISLMNKKARQIHLNNTKFSNPQGFDDKNNFSTVFDVARLGAFSLRFPIIRELVQTKETTITDATKTKNYVLTNVNQLLFTSDEVKGIKTGFTDEAGECLMSLFEKDDKSLIIVVLKSADRFVDSERLANYSFSNFIWDQPLEQRL